MANFHTLPVSTITRIAGGVGLKYTNELHIETGKAAKKMALLMLEKGKDKWGSDAVTTTIVTFGDDETFQVIVRSAILEGKDLLFREFYHISNLQGVGYGERFSEKQRNPATLGTGSEEIKELK